MRIVSPQAVSATQPSVARVVSINATFTRLPPGVATQPNKLMVFSLPSLERRHHLIDAEILLSNRHGDEV